MITFVMTEEHQYTLRAALESGALRREMILLSYEDFLCSERLPESDYVFVDLERLDGAGIEAAARRLEALRRVCPGIAVLNAPRRELGRLEVMRALHSGGQPVPGDACFGDSGGSELSGLSAASGQP